MRSLLLAVLTPLVLCAAPALQIVRPAISQSDGGEPDVPGFEHTAGETLFFSCRISGFAKTPEEKVHVAYSVQAFDPKGNALAELYKNEIFEEVLPQDKDWQPKIETEIALPPLVAAGEYKIVVKAEDLVANQGVTELPVVFRVRGPKVDSTDKIVVRNFGFFRGEDDTQALAKPIYHNGTQLWAKFDIAGYKYGPNNKVDVSYVVSILSGDKVLKSFDPAVDQSESFYPKPWVPCMLGVPLQKVQAGEYILMVKARDAVGNQTAEARRTFTVE